MNKLPSFLCIGTQKAGTSWLYEQLRQHPAIWMPPIKELHYFDHLYCESSRSWSKWHIKQAAKRLIKHQIDNAKQLDFPYIRYVAAMASEPLFTEQWYKHTFNRPNANGKILGDITPEYCQIDDEGVAYVKRFLGDVKIIWIIRDPLERALSQLRMNAERAGFPADDRTIETRMRNLIAEKTQQTAAQLWELAKSEEILRRGNYLDYIPRWEREFDKNNLLFIPFKHIAEQSTAVLQSIENLIGAPNWDGYASPEKKIHATRSFEVPNDVKTYLLEQLQPQYSFLQEHFSADFISAI